MPKRLARRSYQVPERGAKPEVSRVLRKLRGMGLKLEYSMGSNHWRVIDPGTGAYLTGVSSTPSDVNWWHQVRRAVERAGYSWEGKARRKLKQSRSGTFSAVDLEALAHAQHMARIHGGREPQLDDLQDKDFLAQVRKGFNEQETEEAIQHMPQGVESARAHRVISRLLYVVEQRGGEMDARARERNPKIRAGGTIQELMYVSKYVAERRGLRYWKTPESAWQTFSNLLGGINKGMTVWVANLLEATMDEIDGLRYDPPGATPSEPVVESRPAAEPAVGDAPPSITLEEAEDLMADVLSSDWTARADIHSTLVPEQMSNSRFEDALSSLVGAGRAERGRESKKQGGTLYKLATAEPVTKSRPAAALLSRAESVAIVLAAVSNDWILRSDLDRIVRERGVAARTFERCLTQLVSDGQIERERRPDGKSHYRLGKPAPVPQPVDEPPMVVSPEILSDGEDKRSILQAMTGGSIADRYADELLNILRSQTANGNQDWRQMEPILTRLDKLAGVGPEE